jgi:nucleoid DNA-binding protein
LRQIMASEVIVDDIFQFIADSLVNREEIYIKDFGKFVTKLKAARAGHNPATGKPLQIAEKSVVSFKPSTALKTQVV